MPVRSELRFPAANRHIRARLAAGLVRLAVRLQEAAREECPVDTGELRESTRAIADPQRMRVVLTSTAEHAKYVIFGTSRMGPNNFMQRALDRVGPEMATITGRAQE